MKLPLRFGATTALLIGCELLAAAAEPKPVADYRRRKEEKRGHH